MNDSSQGPRPRRAKQADRERYRALGLVTFSVGDGRELVYQEGRGTSSLLSVSEVDLLMGCDVPRTIEEHARVLCGAADVGAERLPMVMYQLSQFVRTGLLVGRRELRDRCGDARGSRAATIAAIGISGGRDPARLERTVRGFSEEAARRGGECRIVVVDEDPGSDNRDRLPKGTFYAGSEERARFAAELSRETGVPPEVIRPALLRGRGASRNLILLESAGDPLLLADDGVTARTGSPPGLLRGVALSSLPDPEECWFTARADGAVNSIPLGTEGLLSLHEEWLGRSVEDVLRTFPEDEVDLDRLDAQYLRLLGSDRLRIRMTETGLAGIRDFVDVLALEGASRERLLESEEAYRLAVEGRGLVRSAVRTTIGNRTRFRGGLAALDGRDLLPPFPDVERSAGDLFAITLRKCFEGTCIAYLPRVAHRPDADVVPEPGAGAFTFPDVLAACLSAFEVGPGRTGGAERLRGVGAYFEELSRMASSDFDAFLRNLLWHRAAGALTRREQDLDTVAVHWGDAIREAGGRTRAAIVRPGFPEGEDVRDRERVRAGLGAWGRLLEAWPTLVEGARALRRRGKGAAVPR